MREEEEEEEEEKVKRKASTQTGRRERKRDDEESEWNLRGVLWERGRECPSETGSEDPLDTIAPLILPMS